MFNTKSTLPGEFIFKILLLLIPIGAFISIIYINLFYSESLANPTTTLTSNYSGPIVIINGSSVITSSQPITLATVVSTPATLGAFDPALGKSSRFLIGLIIFVVAGVIETSLFLIFGAFYLNDPNYSQFPLGLPPGTVRLFLLIIIFLSIFLFALLPTSWGDNKALAFLFGIVSTVVGFYYGSRQDQIGKNNTTNIRLRITVNTVSLTNPVLIGQLDPGFDQPPFSTPVKISIYLMDNTGQQVPKSSLDAVADSNGLVIFDLTKFLNDPDAQQTLVPTGRASYVVQVRAPKSVVCGDRITVQINQASSGQRPSAPQQPTAQTGAIPPPLLSQTPPPITSGQRPPMPPQNPPPTQRPSSPPH